MARNQSPASAGIWYLMGTASMAGPSVRRKRTVKLRVVSDGVNHAKETTNSGILLITHYTRILRYVKPDFVHVFVDGRIAEEGGSELAEKLEAEGYESYVGSKAA